LEQEEEPYYRVHAYSDFFRDRQNVVYGDRFVVLVVAKGSIDCIVGREHRIVEVASYTVEVVIAMREPVAELAILQFVVEAHIVRL
jgi:hypothetical protein